MFCLFCRGPSPWHPDSEIADVITRVDVDVFSFLAVLRRFEGSPQSEASELELEQGKPQSPLGRLCYQTQGGDARQTVSIKTEALGHGHLGTRRLMSFLFLKTPSRDGGWAPTSQLHDCAYQALLISPPQKTRSPHWFQITPPPSPNSSLFPTTLCGVLVFDSVSRASSSSSSAPSPPPLCHTTTFTHHFVTHQLCTHYLTHIFVNHHLSHASLSTTISHTHLCPPSLTHIFVNHHLSHTSLSTTISHTHLCQPPSHLCQPPSLTHTFVHYHLSNTSLSTTISHTYLCQPLSFTYIFVNHHLSHTSLSTTISHTHLCQPPSFTPPSLTHIFVNHLCPPPLSHTSMSTTIFHTHLYQLAGVALGDIHLPFTWQAWHLEASTLVLRGRRASTLVFLRGRRGTYGTGWRLGWF